MLLDTEARGVYPIAPTPFQPDGRVDIASIDRMTDFYREVGSTGMTVLGVMGEAPKLDGAEPVEVAALFVRRAEGLPVGVGVSAPGFAAIRGLARASMDAGAARVMLAPPNTLRTDDQIAGYSRRPPRRALLQHGRGAGGAARRPLPRPGAERRRALGGGRGRAHVARTGRRRPGRGA